jgi:organic radical activating enzyme
MNIEWYAKKKSTPLSPFELNNEGRGKALVLRYADCNLRCPLCYAASYAWKLSNVFEYETDQVLSNLKNLASEVGPTGKKVSWIRIQGGEPCLNLGRTLNTLAAAEYALKEVKSNKLSHSPTPRAVIQTNGVWFSSASQEEVNRVAARLEAAARSVEGRIIFEVSFKSPDDDTYLQPQAAGYRVLLDKVVRPAWESGADNVAVYPVAGLGPSIDFHNTLIVPIDPLRLPDEYPLFHKLTWSNPFRTLVDEFTSSVVQARAYADYRANPKTGGGKKIPLEELEPTRFQTSWMSRYSKPGYKGQPLLALLRKTSQELDRQWGALTRGPKGIIPERVTLLNSVPLSKDPQALLDKVNEMSEYFYPTHPSGHYPYL